MIKRSLSFSFIIFSIFLCFLFKIVEIEAQDELQAIKNAIQIKKAKWIAGETSISKLPKDQRKKLLGLKKLPSKLKKILNNKNFVKSQTIDLPISFDWRNVNGDNYVTSVKYQGSCSSCWIFAPTAGLESAILITNKTPNININLSEQIILSCSYIGDCSGGYIDLSLDFLKNTGIPFDSCSHYVFSEGSCNSASLNWRDNTFKLNSWTYISPSANEIKTAIVKNGPVIASLLIHSDFYSYSNGIYTYTTGTEEGDHAVLIVGYNDTEQYFIAKNSWGALWGINGYCKIAYSEINSVIGLGKPTYAYGKTINPSSIHIMSANSGVGGKITPQGNIMIGNDSELTYTISPDNGYYVKDVTVDSVSLGKIESYKFTNITADHTISAIFESSMPIQIHPIKLHPYSTTLIMNKKLQLIATDGFEPYTWHINDTTIAKIDNKGLLSLKIDAISLLDKLCYVTAKDKYQYSSNVSTVTIPFDYDKDKLPDFWEIKNNINPEDSTEMNGSSGDYDFDGISNYQEYLNNLNPKISDKPGKPSLNWPYMSTEVKDYTPLLSINNAASQSNLSLSYDFIIYSNKFCTEIFDSKFDVKEENITSSWNVSKPLPENNFVFWRARAKNKFVIGDWTDIFNFWINVNKEAPTIPGLDYPTNSAIINTKNVILFAKNSKDPDINSQRFYDFLIAKNKELTIVIDSTSNVHENPNGITTWQSIQTLSEDNYYYWSARCHDEYGLYNSWASTNIFFVNTKNNAPSIPISLSPLHNEEINKNKFQLNISKSYDPENIQVGYIFEYDTGNPINNLSVNYWRSNIIYDTFCNIGPFSDNTIIYWRASAFDGEISSPWSNTQKIFINTINDAPSIPILKYPINKEKVIRQRPVLEVYPSFDPDDDNINFNYQVKDTNDNLITYSGNKKKSWEIDTNLILFNSYKWRAQSIDIHNLSSEWTDYEIFKYDTGNIAPNAPECFSPENNKIIATLYPSLIVKTPYDENEDVVRIKFFIYEFGNSEKFIESEWINSSKHYTTWNVTQKLNDLTKYIWFAKSTDGKAESSPSNSQNFTLILGNNEIINIEPPIAKIQEGETQTFIITNNNTFAPYYWSTTNEEIGTIIQDTANINSTIFFAKRQGNCKISVKDKFNYFGSTGIINVYKKIYTTILDTSKIDSTTLQTSTAEKKKKICLISELATHNIICFDKIKILINFRDRFLLKNKIGKYLVNFYYTKIN